MKFEFTLSKKETISIIEGLVKVAKIQAKSSKREKENSQQISRMESAINELKMSVRDLKEDKIKLQTKVQSATYDINKLQEAVQHTIK